MAPVQPAATMKTGRSLLMEGLTDAAGFLGGAVLGWWLAALLGFEVATDGYSTSRIVGVALVILGGSLGLQQARRLRKRQTRLQTEQQVKRRNGEP